ncbi:MAG: hypothetical protein H6648_08735 [Caldilineae bacterium]|nr:hypothetical protein [Caldilineae bacterium]
MTKRTTIRKPDLASQARLKADQRQRQMLRKGEFLRSQGAPVVLTQLPFNGLTVMIRRVDLVVLASSGSWPEPISSRVAQMVRLTPGAEEHYATAELERQSLAACAAVAKACVVVPPEAFMAGEIDEAQIDLRTLKPFFVDEDPDEDQVILRVLEGELLPAGEAADAGALHHRDLVHIMTTAYLLGPGGLGKFFRGQDSAVAQLADLAAAGDAAQ